MLSDKRWASARFCETVAWAGAVAAILNMAGGDTAEATMWWAGSAFWMIVAGRNLPTPAATPEGGSGG